MTKKDYIKIASVIKEAWNKTTDKQAIRHIITGLEKVFYNDNDLFDAKRFEKAIDDKLIIFFEYHQND